MIPHSQQQSANALRPSGAIVQVADKRQRDPSKRSVLAGRCKQPEGIVGDTPYHPRCPTDPTEFIPDTDARPLGSSQFSYHSTRCKRYLDFSVREPAVGFSQRTNLKLQLICHCELCTFLFIPSAALS